MVRLAQRDTDSQHLPVNGFLACIVTHAEPPITTWNISANQYVDTRPRQTTTAVVLGVQDAR